MKNQETLYSTDMLSIHFNEKEKLVLPSWTGQSMTAETFMQEMKNYMQLLERLPAERVIWDHTFFNFQIPDSLYNWIESEVNLPARKLGMKKIGFILGKDVMAQFSTMDSFETTNSVYAPRYFPDPSSAVDWITKEEKEIYNPFEKEISLLIEKNLQQGKARIQIELSLEQLPFYLKRLKEMFNHQHEVHKNFRKFMLLTPREKAVLELAIQGCSNRIIAEQSCCSIHTIATHRKNIMRKLECSNIAELVRYKLFLQL